MASVTPVVDGFVLRKGMSFNLELGGFSNDVKGLVYSSLPRLVRAHARHTLVSATQNRPGIGLVPHELIESKVVGVAFAWGVLHANNF